MPKRLRPISAEGWPAHEFPQSCAPRRRRCAGDSDHHPSLPQEPLSRWCKWGAMHLLESVIRTNQRRIRIEQLILLMIRAAIPLLLALAMARPIWQGAQKLLGDAKTSTVLLLDNSYSMEAGRPAPRIFPSPATKPTRLINDLKRGSDVQVVLMGEGGASLLDRADLRHRRASRRRSRSLSAGYGAATVPAALDYRRRHLRANARVRAASSSCSPTSSASVSRRRTTRLLGQIARPLEEAPDRAAHHVFRRRPGGQRQRRRSSRSTSRGSWSGSGRRSKFARTCAISATRHYPDLRVYFKADGKEKSCRR